MLAARVILYFGAEATYSLNRSPMSGGGRVKKGTFTADMIDLFSPYWYYCKPDEDSIIRVFIVYAIMFNINDLIFNGCVAIYFPLIMLGLYVFLRGSYGAFHIIELAVMCLACLKFGVIATLLFLFEERIFLSVFRGLKQGS